MKKDIKLCILNYSGNVGKSTLAQHMFMPRMPNAQYFSVESINSSDQIDSIEVEQLRGRQFNVLHEELLGLDSAVVDVGSSNVELFLQLMAQNVDSHSEFDLFILPTVSEDKQQKDTIETIRLLNKLGVPAKKIRVLFNRVEIDSDTDAEFETILSYKFVTKSFQTPSRGVVYENPAFQRVGSTGKTLNEIVNDTTDYRAKLRASTDENEKDFCKKMITIRGMAISANANMNEAFEAITS
ncbi:StbB family protein [Iodobacter fluviatilis]|uniref:Plasmid stability protein StbB n=1 Tax=Iodobacter fluviatilis TaxID=537 RepID=A0A377Q5H2_9NEIS|nr:StbB family protein [Iodobacter fluviatilis]TCU84539.1 hypothetical protein EV682_10964 [Iodobacter fluviatilis]STQ90005.1 Uncharacterised protein [Iodobacter fluviatilis]